MRESFPEANQTKTTEDNVEQKFNGAAFDDEQCLIEHRDWGPDKNEKNGTAPGGAAATLHMTIRAIVITITRIFLLGFLGMGFLGLFV